MLTRSWRHALLIAVLCLPPAALAESAAQREINQALALQPDAEHGRELFSQCAACKPFKLQFSRRWQRCGTAYTRAYRVQINFA